MVSEHTHFTVHPGLEEKFESTYRDIRDVLLSASGCQGAQLHRSIDKPGVYLLQVHWNSLSDHTEVFPSTAAGKEVTAALAPLFAAAEVTHFSEHAL